MVLLENKNHSSAIADHVTSTGHNMKWDHFEILTRGWSDTHCKMKETLLIRDIQPYLNENVSSEKLHVMFLLYVIFCFFNELLILHLNFCCYSTVYYFRRCMLEHTKHQVKVFFFRNASIFP